MAGIILRNQSNIKSTLDGKHFANNDLHHINNFNGLMKPKKFSDEITQSFCSEALFSSRVELLKTLVNLLTDK